VVAVVAAGAEEAAEGPGAEEVEEAAVPEEEAGEVEAEAVEVEAGS
jgi:hypothetical protein